MSQTTLSVDETLETVAALRERFPSLESPPSDDICYATQNRQAAVKVIAPRVDLFLVVGSANSSNSVRMVEVARTAGADAAYLVENARAMDAAWLDGVATVGLSSGASVPEILVREVIDWLAEHGYGELEEVDAHRGAADVRASPAAAPRAAPGRPAHRLRPRAASALEDECVPAAMTSTTPVAAAMAGKP